MGNNEGNAEKNAYFYTRIISFQHFANNFSTFFSDIFFKTLVLKYYEENLTFPFGKHFHACRVG